MSNHLITQKNLQFDKCHSHNLNGYFCFKCFKKHLKMVLKLPKTIWLEYLVLWRTCFYFFNIVRQLTRLSSVNLATSPKSPILKLMDDSSTFLSTIKTFAGLTSRWKKPSSRISLRPEHTCKKSISNRLFPSFSVQYNFMH